jgi:putative transposase
LPGGTYFFTQTLHNRKANYLIEHIDSLRSTMKQVQQKMPFSIIAIVVLPEHLHAICKLPADDSNYAGRGRLIKSYFTQSLTKQKVPLLKNPRGEYNLWQKRYWEHTIKDEADLEAHIDYIHYNPVKHGLVKNPVDWPYSSFHSFVRKNLLTTHWGKHGSFSSINFGE